MMRAVDETRRKRVEQDQIISRCEANGDAQTSSPSALS